MTKILMKNLLFCIWLNKMMIRNSDLIQYIIINYVGVFSVLNVVTHYLVTRGFISRCFTLQTYFSVSKYSVARLLSEREDARPLLLHTRYYNSE